MANIYLLMAKVTVTRAQTRGSLSKYFCIYNGILVPVETSFGLRKT